jgi:hypothetical protein
VTPRQPRPGTPHRGVREEPGESRRAPQRKATPNTRLAAIAIGLLVIAAAIVAIVLALEPSNHLHLVHSFGGNAQSVINKLTQLIQTNQS